MKMKQKSFMLSIIVMTIIFLFIISAALLNLPSWTIITLAVVGGVIMIVGAFIIRAKNKDEK